MKWSRSNDEHFHRDLRNGHTPKARKQPHGISETHRQMKQFKPVLVQKKKNDTVKGSKHTKTRNEDESNEFQGVQHLGDGVKKCHCSKFDRFKHNFHGARNFKLTRKVDGSAINTQEIIDQKFKDLKEDKRSTNGSGTASGTQ